MLQLLADVTQESLCVWALQQPLGRFRAKGRRNKDEIDSPFFFGSQFLMESFDLLDPWISTLAHVCSTWPLILHLSPCTPWQFSPLMVAYFRPFEPTDAAESAIADGRRWLQSCASGQTQAVGCWRIWRYLSFGSFGFWFLFNSWIQVSRLVAHPKARKEVENTIHEILKTCGPPDLRIQQRFEMLIRRLAWQSPFSHEHDITRLNVLWASMIFYVLWYLGISWMLWHQVSSSHLFALKHTTCLLFKHGSFANMDKRSSLTSQTQLMDSALILLQHAMPPRWTTLKPTSFSGCIRWMTKLEVWREDFAVWAVGSTDNSEGFPRMSLDPLLLSVLLAELHEGVPLLQKAPWWEHVRTLYGCLRHGLLASKIFKADVAFQVEVWGSLTNVIVWSFASVLCLGISMRTHTRIHLCWLHQHWKLIHCFDQEKRQRRGPCLKCALEVSRAQWDIILRYDTSLRNYVRLPQRSVWI